MPSTSKKQHNMMAAVAHSPAFAKKVGIPQSVGKEFVTADKGKVMKKYSGADGKSQVSSSSNKPTPKDIAAMQAAKKNDDALTKTLNAPSTPPVKITKAPSNKPTPKDIAAMQAAKENDDALVKTLNSPGPNMKRGGKVKKMAKGGMAEKDWEGSAKDVAQDKKLAKKRGMSMADWEKSPMDAKHDKQQSMSGLKKGGPAKVKKMCSGGMASGGSARGNGFAAKGKTRGRFI